MGYLAKRRIVGVLLLLAAVVVVVWGQRQLAPAMRQVGFLTGWVLLAACAFLTLYNLRKRLPFLPLGNSRTWLQLHAYVGYLSFALFFAHTGWSWSHSWFDQVLGLLFLSVALSGVFGLFWSRFIPRRLTTRGGDVLFERIPIVRRELADRAKALALESVTATKTTTIVDFYSEHLVGFLGTPANFWRHLVESRTALSRLQARIDDLNRFLNPDQRKALNELAEIVRQKDGLDYQFALQLSLRLWLFIHIPLTYSLLIFVALHVVVVFGFSAGVPMP